jgi:hypothetical protein
LFFKFLLGESKIWIPSVTQKLTFLIKGELHTFLLINYENQSFLFQIKQASISNHHCRVYLNSQFFYVYNLDKNIWIQWFHLQLVTLSSLNIHFLFRIEYAPILYTFRIKPTINHLYQHLYHCLRRSICRNHRTDYSCKRFHKVYKARKIFPYQTFFLTINDLHFQILHIHKTCYNTVLTFFL